MAQIFCVLGNKGGTGKTTISHMLGQGLGLLGFRTVVAVTDETREPLSRAGRRYLPADARSPEQLARIAAKLRGLDGWIGVIDGGGGRTEFDTQLARMASVVLLPFRDSHEDLRTVLKDLERFPAACGVPSQWPTNTFARDAAQRSLEALLADYADRFLPPVMSLSATKLLLQLEIPASLPTPVSAACRSLAREACRHRSAGRGIAGGKATRAGGLHCRAGGVSQRCEPPGAAQYRSMEIKMNDADQPMRSRPLSVSTPATKRSGPTGIRSPNPSDV